MSEIPPPMDEDAGRILRFGEALDNLGQDTGDFIVRISLRAITGEPIGEKILSRRELEALTGATESLVAYRKDDEAETAPGGNTAWTPDTAPAPDDLPELHPGARAEMEQLFDSLDSQSLLQDADQADDKAAGAAAYEHLVLGESDQ